MRFFTHGCSLQALTSGIQPNLSSKPSDIWQFSEKSNKGAFTFLELMVSTELGMTLTLLIDSIISISISGYHGRNPSPTLDLANPSLNFNKTSGDKNS